MAKWGEGDPRWLVEDRQDGTNVNAWHWQETNKLEWSKQRLAELLPGTEAAAAASVGPAAGWAARVTGVKSVTGEAMLTTRKGNKRFAFYDLKLTLAWEAAPAAAAAGGDSADQPAATAAGAEAEPAAGDGADADADAGPSATAAAAAAAAGVADAFATTSISTKEAAAATGELSVAEFGSGSDHEDIEVTVTVSGGSGSSGDKEVARKLAQAALWPVVLQKLEQYVRELEQA